MAPTIVVLCAGARVSSAGDFATHTGSIGGWGALLAGGGFWQYDQQVGAVGVGGALAGLVLTALAVVGRRDLDGRWGRGATALAVTGLLLAVSSAVPGVRGAYRWLSLLVWLYVTEGAVRSTSERGLSMVLALVELGLCLLLFVASALYIRWRLDKAVKVAA